MRSTIRVIALLLIMGFLVSHSAAVAADEVQTSALWGKAGERWSPEGRLPDFSFAGYQRGEKEIPTPPVTHNVRDFGAVGDGVADDSDAFLTALDVMESGVLWVPEGRYRITKILPVDKPNLVVRGAGPGKSICYFPTPLNDIAPNWGATTGGQRTSNYSWSGGFFSIGGKMTRTAVTPVEPSAKRGDRQIVVETSTTLAVGQTVELRQEDDETNSLAIHLYSDDPRTSVEKIRGRTQAALIARIIAINGKTLTLDRPLRFDLRTDWKPTLNLLTVEVTESGVESLGFEFPNEPYEGHFSELGYNAFAIQRAMHCWVRDIRIHNADSGGFVRGAFNTVSGVVITSDRKADKNRQSVGHHGIESSGDDNLITGFDFQCEFIHDLTVSHCAGNVFSDGRGEDLSLDHHRRAPYENLFTNLNVGKGSRIWQCGGGPDLGAHCGARGTFWNIQSDHPVALPNKNFGPWSLNLVGVEMSTEPSTETGSRWYEHVEGGSVHPANLHTAQHKRRVETSE